MHRAAGLSVIVLFFLSLILFLVSFVVPEQELLTVAFLDVGQGDAIYVEAPSGEQMLVDAGKDRTVLSRLSEVMPWLDRSIDVVVATHPDADHIGGLVSVLDTYEVDRVVTSGATAETKIFEAVYDRTLSEGAEVSLVRRGSTIQLGEVFVEVLYPEQVFNVGDKNISSIALQVHYGEHQFLLTGDLGVEQELYLIETYGDSLQSEILKLGHHGSNTSTAKEFLEVVAPHAAIVSAGKDNSYGHPHEDVVGRVNALGISLLSTAAGTVVFESDGVSLRNQ